MRLIDADALKDEIQDAITILENHGVNCVTTHWVTAIVRTAPGIDAIPLTAMAKWLAGYAAPPNGIMRDFFSSGAEITHESLTAAWEMTLRGIDWEGLS